MDAIINIWFHIDGIGRQTFAELVRQTILGAPAHPEVDLFDTVTNPINL